MWNAEKFFSFLFQKVGVPFSMETQTKVVRDRFGFVMNNEVEFTKCRRAKYCIGGVLLPVCGMVLVVLLLLTTGSKGNWGTRNSKK